MATRSRSRIGKVSYRFALRRKCESARTPSSSVFPRPAAPPESSPIMASETGSMTLSTFSGFRRELTSSRVRSCRAFLRGAGGKSFLRILTLECTQPFRRTFGVALDLAPGSTRSPESVQLAKREDVVRHVVAERHGAVVVERTQAVEPVAVFLLHDKERPRDAVAGFRREVVLPSPLQPPIRQVSGDTLAVRHVDAAKA